MQVTPVQRVIDAVREGRMVIVVDDEDRENEGDLVMAAASVRPQDINFMARFGRGLICLTLTQERCRRLGLPLMVPGTNDHYETNFTVSIDSRDGVTTGISAADRAHTIRTAVAGGAEDVRQPGHVFPIMARAGGVLSRAGHTEAGCDLARLAGLEAAAVIVEILNEDGSMARRPELDAFAREHDLPIATIEDLIRYRVESEKTVQRVAECPLATEYGDFRMVAYQDAIDRGVHVALARGDVAAAGPCLVRVQVEDVLNDVLLAPDAHSGWSMRTAMRRIAEEGRGVAVLLRLPQSGAALLAQVRGLGAHPPAPSPPALEHREEHRMLGIGSQILADLGVARMRLLSAPKKYPALGGFGLEVVEYISQ